MTDHMMLDETVTQKATRLLRMADAIEESSRRSSEERLSLVEEVDEECESSSHTLTAEQPVQEAPLEQPMPPPEEQPIPRPLHVDAIFTKDRSSKRFTIPEDESTELDHEESHVISPPSSPPPKRGIKREGSALTFLFQRATNSLDSEELDDSQSFWSKRSHSSRGSQEKNPTQKTRESRSDLVNKTRSLQNALVSMRENAKLRFQGLEMKHALLQEQHADNKAKLVSVSEQLEVVQNEKQLLEHSMEEMHGKEVTAILKHLNKTKMKLEKELTRVRSERDKALLELKEERLARQNCPTCTPPPKLDRRKSWWQDAVNATSQYLHLEKETEAMDVASVVTPSKRDESLLNSASSRTRNLHLDPSGEELKKRLDQDLESLKDEWSSSRAASVTSKGSYSKRGRGGSGKSFRARPRADTTTRSTSTTRSTLENFFSNTASLNDEELDENRSFWSKSFRSSKRNDDFWTEDLSTTAGSHGKKKTTTTTDDDWEHFSTIKKAAMLQLDRRSTLRQMLSLDRKTQPGVDAAARGLVRQQEEEKETNELLARQWTSPEEEDPLGFIGKEVTAWSRATSGSTSRGRRRKEFS